MKYFVDYLPVTTGNDLRLYVDGKAYCADLAASLRGARRFVFLTGLHFMADFRLERTGTSADVATTLARMLADVAERGVTVYLLVNQFWKDEMELDLGKTAPIRQLIMRKGELHGYLPESFRLFHMLSGHRNVHCRTDIHPNSDTFATNHQKTVVVDDKVAFLGGIDLTYLDGDRWDTPGHLVDLRAVDRTNVFWHDVHLRVQGPAVQFVRDNFVQRWRHGDLHVLFTGPGTQRGIAVDRNRPLLPTFTAPRVAYKYPTEQETPDVQTVQIVRSMPRKKRWRSEKPAWNKGKDDYERSCKEAYLIGIRAARNYIYLENQWVADEDIWSELAAAAKRNNQNPDFRIILMVPYKGLFAAGFGSNQELFIGAEMEEVIENSHSESTFGMYAMEQKLPRIDPNREEQHAQIYVHSKILIVDDEWALIGSANAGGISLEGMRGGRDEPDSELSAIILDRTFAAQFRKAVWEEHLLRKVGAAYDVHDADQFRRLAGQPRRHKLRFYPEYDKLKRGRPTWWPYIPEPDVYPVGLHKASRIVPAFPEDLAAAGIPPTLMTASFRAHIIPDPPPAYRCWYRWRCDLFYVPQRGFEPERSGTGLRLRSLKYDRDDVFQYNDQDTVYLGEKTAKFIDNAVGDTARGRIVCRIQIVPRTEGPDPDNQRWPSLLLQYECLFMNSRFARHNHPSFFQYRPTP